MKTKTKVISGVATIAALSAAGIGVASAAPTSSPSSPTSTAAHQQKGDHKGAKQHGLFARALHGEATVGGAKKHRVVDFQRGTVTAVGDGKLTVKSVDGFSATYSTTSQTKVRKDKATSSVSAVQVNDRVRVIGTKDGSTITLKSIGDRGPKK